MQIRKSTITDLAEIMQIYAAARQFMAETGNPNQWINGYPGEAVILKDIEQGHHYVCLDDGRMVGCFTFAEGDDPTYAVIEKGEWLNDAPYAVLHRIAVLEPGKGIGAFCINWCLVQSANVRVDTHQDNQPMQNLLKKKGFLYCGVIYTDRGDERLAFQVNK